MKSDLKNSNQAIVKSPFQQQVQAQAQHPQPYPIIQAGFGTFGQQTSPDSQIFTFSALRSNAIVIPTHHAKQVSIEM